MLIRVLHGVGLVGPLGDSTEVGVRIPGNPRMQGLTPWIRLPGGTGAVCEQRASCCILYDAQSANRPQEAVKVMS